jgi:hypothetical protein
LKKKVFEYNGYLVLLWDYCNTTLPFVSFKENVEIKQVSNLNAGVAKFCQSWHGSVQTCEFFPELTFDYKYHKDKLRNASETTDISQDQILSALEYSYTTRMCRAAGWPDYTGGIMA